MADILPILAIACVCAAWIALQRWIGRVDPDLKRDRPCGGCCGDKLCDIQKNDPWCSGAADESRKH